jgi:transposase
VFGLGPATRIYLAAGVTDMRKGFEGLYGLVRDRLSCEPLSGHLFLFCNAQRNRLKVLVWDGSGLWVCAKRLEKGRFTWPQSGDAQGKVVLSHEELSLLLGGIDLAKTKHKRWYRKAPPEGHAAARLRGCLKVSIDSGKSVTHCEGASHSFRTGRPGTYRSTEEQATVRGAPDSAAGRASAADEDREIWSVRRKTFASTNAIVRACARRQ